MGYGRKGKKKGGETWQRLGARIFGLALSRVASLFSPKLWRGTGIRGS